MLVGWHPEAITARRRARDRARASPPRFATGSAGVYAKRKLCGRAELRHRLRRASSPRRVALAPALPFTTVPGPVSPLVIANVVALAIASTAIAYLIYFKLIADVGPARALTVTFLIPLFGVLWGFLFLGEALDAQHAEAAAR